MHFIACPPATSEAGASRPKSLAGAIFMVYPQKYKNCSTLVTNKSCLQFCIVLRLLQNRSLLMCKCYKVVKVGGLSLRASTRPNYRFYVAGFFVVV
jgi:hypothetical protein